MDSLTLNSHTCFSKIQFISQPFYHYANYKPRTISFNTIKQRKCLVFASKGGPELDEWDRMEIKFGKMIGEDPKLTLAKIMGRKSNPDLSYLEIEKLLENKKSKTEDDEVEEELLFDASIKIRSTKPVEGLNLVRPVPKRGNKFQETDKSVEANYKSRVQGLDLVRPSPIRETKFEATDKPASDKSREKPILKPTEERKSNLPNVILRKPSSFKEDDNGKSTRFSMKPNLSLKMWKEPQKRGFSDMTLLRRPEQITNSTDIGDEDELLDSKEKVACDATLLQKPELVMPSLNEVEQESLDESSSSNVVISNSLNKIKEIDYQLDKESATELQADMWSDEKSFNSDCVSWSSPEISTDMTLIQRPKRLDISSKTPEEKTGEETTGITTESSENPLEIENLPSTSPIKEGEEFDWDRAEKLAKTGEREEVELISSSTRGFAVLFGSLIGFLPYRNLTARWKFLAFESWLRRKGLDPGIYRQNLGIIGKYDADSVTDFSGPGEINSKPDREILSSDMKLEDLLMIYDQEKLKFLSSFVGQRLNVGVVLADRKFRRLIVSLKPKEKEELVEKKKSLMAQLSVGYIVKCCITKITYFGIFVEVEGVPALIHQTEVSWDSTLDPESYFKVGQIVEAKVHQLDFSLERIFLSLKEITPDPLLEALDAVVGDQVPFGGELEAAQTYIEWEEVESLITELEQFEGIQSVTKGSYFASPGLAPTFQVYMASMFENRYKLLARAGNRVQESIDILCESFGQIFVQTSLSKDEVKYAISTCTNMME